MRLQHIAIIGILAAFSFIPICAQNETRPTNNTTSFPPPYPNTANMTMHYNLTSPALHAPRIPAPTINVALNKTASGPIVITGTVYTPSPGLIILRVQNPQGNLVLVSQMQPSSNGGFSLTFVPLAPLWSPRGNYTVTVWSLSQEIASTTFHFNGTSNRPNPIPVARVEALPLDQFRSGIQAQDIACNYDLRLVLKAEDHTPACVNPYVALRLAQIGWAVQNSSAVQQLPDPLSALRLNLSVSPEVIHPREFVTIKISVNNTNNYPIYVAAQHKWAYQDIDSPCQKLRLGVAILKGYYTPENVTQGKSLQLFNRYDCGISQLETGKVYEFEPQSYMVKEIMCYMYFGEPCHSEGLNTNYGFDGYMDRNNTKQYFGAGKYTVVGADEWGHIAIQHFTVARSTLAQTQKKDTSSAAYPCDTPYDPKENVITPLLPNGTHTITEYTPIFYVPTNSAGKICVQYSNGNQPVHVGIRVFEANNLAKDSDTVTTSASQDIIPTGNSTVAYTINSGSKAGFYGVSLFCGGHALAIGYDNNSRIVLDDFPWYGQIFHCPALTYDYKVTGLSNIGIYYITKTTREQIGYNITGVSVSSVHPTSTIQNVTFSFNVRTYNSGAHLWYDYKDSTLSKYSGDPGLKEESNPCLWDITNPYSLDNAQEIRFMGNVVVNDNPVTIPPYSNGTYTFSIFAKGLGPGIYTLRPTIFSYSTDSDIPQDRRSGSEVANNYPITIGLDHNIDPSGICSW